MGEALGYSLLAGLLTGAGAIPLLFMKQVSHRLKDTLLGFAAGVMVSVSFISLLFEALEIGGLLEIILGLASGFIVISLIEYLIPHLELGDMGEAQLKLKKRMILIAAAISLHNIPEGFAIGVSFGSDIPGLGLLIVVAIAIHNAPEGLVVAAPLKELGYSKLKILLFTAATGLSMPIGTLIGFLLVGWADAILPFGLAFAAGAMLYVVSHELLPESHSHGYKREASFAFLVGIILIILLDLYFV